MGAACPMIGTLAIRRRRRRADRGRMCLAAMVGVLLLAAACAPGAHPGAGRTEEARALAVRFVTTLAERRYAAAHALTDPSYRARVSAEQLQAEFEQIVPLTFGPVGPVEAGLTQTQWYGQEPGDEAQHIDLEALDQRQFQAGITPEIDLEAGA